MTTPSLANAPAGSVAPKLEEQSPNTHATAQAGPNALQSQFNPTSEVQVVSSLAKLQELERRIHELRQFLPEGLLEPLVPIANPHKLPPEHPVAESPPQLRNDLAHVARTRLATIEQFQSIWRGSELKPIWAHVETRMREANGQLVQPTGIWEKDYDVLLAEILKADRLTEENQQSKEEEAERAKVQSSEVEWQAIVERFIQRNVPGVRTLKGQDAPTLTLALARAGMAYQVEGVRESDVPGISEWQVRSQMAPGRTPTKLEQSILACLHARPRKWDLAFLLDMIASYADIKQTTCVKCARLTNNAAQLPTIRRAQSTLSPASPAGAFVFDALHSNCA
ncbi:uncharacterized protein N7459_005454 [Penicillium hispanicum]|uniref:uncharacterized protein n=1 Tax=Penicillium hispanicum TaxID=1080232 RepID=UPI002540A9FA|nr:uncharacterized protein N7459_005454 [Penicillium hispanicum]KAJ5579469.1 hypothetical protein N7459_005454 [Penicillium hispanicum]